MFSSVFFTYIHVSLRHQTATGWAWFDCSNLHIDRWGLLGVCHLFNFVCKNKTSGDEQQKRRGHDIICKAFEGFFMGQTQANHSQWPFPVCPHWVADETETKNTERKFCGGGHRRTLMKCIGVRPASQAVQALSKQPTQQHHPTLRVVASLNVKWAMNVKSVKFAVIFLSLIFFHEPATWERCQRQIWQNWTSLWRVMMPSDKSPPKGFMLTEATC